MATQALRYLSSRDGYLPQASNYVIAHVRDEKLFPLNRYVQYVPSNTTDGVFAVLGRDEFVRVPNVYRSRWQDGSRRPSALSSGVPYQWVPYHCERHSFGWELGHEAVSQTAKYGAFDPKPIHMMAGITRCMTERTLEVQTLLQTQGNWPASQQSTADALNGGAGPWNDASDNPADPGYEAIYLSLSGAAQIIHQMTNGQVKPSDLRIIVSPQDARLIAKAPEIVNFMRQSPAARDIIENGLDPQYALWGLPTTYKGFHWVVDDCVFVNTEPNTTQESGAAGAVPEAPLSTTGRQYVWQSGSAVIVSRVGGLDGTAGVPSFSTVQMYHQGGLAQVEAKDEWWDRLILGAVSEERVIVIAAPFAGMFIGGIIG